MTRVLAVTVLISLSLPTAWAGTKTVYQCEKDGVVIYSQVECGEDAKSVIVELQQGLPEKDYQAPHVHQQQSVDQYLAEQDKTRQIGQHKARIESYKKQLKQAFDGLKETRFRSAEEKDKAIKALSDKYNGLIKAEQEAIKALLKN